MFVRKLSEMKFIFLKLFQTVVVSLEDNTGLADWVFIEIPRNKLSLAV